MPKKILFFIDSLVGGGKERRFLELIHYLKKHTNFQLKIILTEDDIHYKYVYNLAAPITIIKRRLFKKDPFLFFRFYKIAKEFNPDLIHAWGSMTTLYSIPPKIILKRPLVSNLIADSNKKFKNWSFSSLIFKINCYFSDIIISNSKAGIKAYNLSNHPRKIIIYNGVHLERFELNIDKNKTRNEIQVNTPFIVIMVAKMSENKDYDLFLDVAKLISNVRDDVTFIGVGNGPNFKKMQNRIINENIRNVKLTGFRNDVEELIAISDIGVLFTYSEGISNSIIEYMASSKPVITTDVIGGTREILVNEKIGIIMERNVEQIAEMITQLLGDDNLRKSMGEKGKQIIEDKFNIDRMGKEYLKVYESYTN